MEQQSLPQLSTIRSLTKASGILSLIFGALGIIAGIVVFFVSFIRSILTVHFYPEIVTSILMGISGIFMFYIGMKCFYSIPQLLSKTKYAEAREKTLVYLIIAFIFGLLGLASDFGGIYLIIGILLLISYFMYEDLMKALNL